MAHQIFRIKKAFTIKDAPEIMKQNCLIFMENGHNRAANNIIQRNEGYIREKMSHMVEKQFGEYGIKEPATRTGKGEENQILRSGIEHISTGSSITDQCTCHVS